MIIEGKKMVESYDSIALFWMDNFSEVYIRNYNYTTDGVPWAVRNLTATAVWNFNFSIPGFSQMPLIKFHKHIGEFSLQMKLKLAKCILTLLQLFEKTSDEPISFKNLKSYDNSPFSLCGILQTVVNLQQDYFPNQKIIPIFNCDIAFFKKWWQAYAAAEDKGVDL